MATHEAYRRPRFAVSLRRDFHFVPEEWKKMHTKSRKWLKNTGLLALVTAVLVTSTALQPASADPDVVYVTLPAGANGTNGNPDLLAYACPALEGRAAFVEVLAPLPYKPDGLSSYELTQPGTFEWYLYGDSGTVYRNSDEEYAATSTLHLPHNKPISSEVVLRLEGYIDVRNDVNPTPTDFVFRTTVVDPTFTSGIGTILDPYLVSSQADLQKMRCHKNKHFALENDITLVGKWLPIGTDEYSYNGDWEDSLGNQAWSGSLDGRGHSISGLDTGFIGADGMGLFGFVEDSYFKNLELINPVVIGKTKVGALVGSAEAGVGIENVKVVDAEVTGLNNAGLLLGNYDYGGIISFTTVSGSLNAPAVVYTDAPSLIAIWPNDVGGMLGRDQSDGTTHLNNEVDVSITVFSEVDYFKAAADLGFFAPNNNNSTEQIGGYVGETDADSIFRYLKIKSDISIETLADVEQIGGVVGNNEEAWSEIEASTKIHIVALSNTTVRRVGGFFGVSDDQTVSFAKIDTDILIELDNSDGSNNKLGISNSTSRIIAHEVGGVAGKYTDGTSDMFVRAHANITIRNAAEVFRVGGYAGVYEDDEGVGYSDLFVTGAISVDASESISRIGGFLNLTESGKISGTKLFSAVSISTFGVARNLNLDSDWGTNNPFINPFVGELERPAEQLAFKAFWDSDVNGLTNPPGYPASPATTSQLKSKEFLSGLGMDFEKVWKLTSGSYPELKEGVYTWGFIGSTVGGSSSSGSSSVTIQPEKLVRTEVPGFAANSAKLTKKMKQQVREFLRANPKLNSVVCKGFTSAPATPQDRALARERGKVTCDLIKKLRPEVSVTIRSGSHSFKPGLQTRRVQLTLK